MEAGYSNIQIAGLLVTAMPFKGIVMLLLELYSFLGAGEKSSSIDLIVCEQRTVEQCPTYWLNEPQTLPLFLFISLAVCERKTVMPSSICSACLKAQKFYQILVLTKGETGTPT